MKVSFVEQNQKCCECKIVQAVAATANSGKMQEVSTMSMDLFLILMMTHILLIFTPFKI
jgi:hypothetical protein